MLTCRQLISWRPNLSWRTRDYCVHDWRPGPLTGANEWNWARCRVMRWYHPHRFPVVVPAPLISTLATRLNLMMLAPWICLHKRTKRRERKKERDKWGCQAKSRRGKFQWATKRKPLSSSHHFTEPTDTYEDWTGSSKKQSGKKIKHKMLAKRMLWNSPANALFTSLMSNEQTADPTRPLVLVANVA